MFNKDLTGGLSIVKISSAQLEEFLIDQSGKRLNVNEYKETVGKIRELLGLIELGLKKFKENASIEFSTTFKTVYTKYL